jgi:hypothetical protein
MCEGFLFQFAQAVRHAGWNHAAADHSWSGHRIILNSTILTGVATLKELNPTAQESDSTWFHLNKQSFATHQRSPCAIPNFTFCPVLATFTAHQSAFHVQLRARRHRQSVVNL